MTKLIKPGIHLILLCLLTGCAPNTNHTSDNQIHNHEPTPYVIYERVALYFPNPEEAQLEKEQHELSIQENTSTEKLILDTMKMGPKNDHLTSPIAVDAKINSIKTVSGLCTIDFSEQFLNTDNGNTQTANLMLQSIVQSLCELNTIQQVKINIDGNTTAKINGEIDLSQPISPNTTK